MIKMQLKKQHFLLRQTYDTQRTLQITMFATAEYRHVPRWRKKKSNPGLHCIITKLYNYTESANSKTSQ